MPSITLITLTTLDKHSLIAKAFCEDSTIDVSQANAFADASSGWLNGFWIAIGTL